MTQSTKVGAVILVGGQGTRLRPLTLHRPKALMPILNRPFLSYQFELLKKAGVRYVVLAANPVFQKWRNQLKKIVPAGTKLEFAFEPKPLGTGGAIRYGYDHLKKKFGPVQSVIVLNGDVLIEVDLSRLLKFHAEKKGDATIVLTEVPDISRFGLVEVNESHRVKAFLEKPKKSNRSGWVNAGIYAMGNTMIETIPQMEPSSVERDIFPSALRHRKKIFGFNSSGYWNDIGTTSSYLQAHLDLIKKKSFWTGKRNLCMGKHPRIKPDVRFFGAVCLGSNVLVGSRCKIRNSVVMNNVQIGDDVSIMNSIVGEGCTIGKNSILHDGAVLGDKTVVPPHSKI